MINRRSRAALAVASLAVLVAAGCSGADDPEPSTGSPPSPSPSASPAPPESAEPAVAPDDDVPFGTGCDRVRLRGGPALAKLADVPTPIFISRVGALQDAFGAMSRAGVTDRPGATYFVPTNQAINALPLEVRSSLVLDPVVAERFFSHLVVEGRLAPSELGGDHETIGGTTLTIAVEGPDDVRVGVQRARVLCGNIRTADATFYVLDQALQS